MNIYEAINNRGLIDQLTHQELAQLLNQKKLKFYVGFDPTAESFHVGQLAVFNLIKLMQKGGHIPIVLMGKATGMIGDPSGKNTERKLLDTDKINYNATKLQKQFEKILLTSNTADQVLFVDNYDWLKSLSTIEFLRDVGKHFSVNQMLTKDSVSSRLNSGGITYTEFSYMILQAYDFKHLAAHYDCDLQLGGSDQWSNILSGIELTRRLLSKQVYGITMPLITKPDGTKFGKSNSGTVWLDSNLTSPYQFYQFFLRTEDSQIIKLLKMLTMIDLAEIKELQMHLENSPEDRKPQLKLATYLTEMVHGSAELKKCQQASQVLYGGSLTGLSFNLLADIFNHVPSYQLDREVLSQGWDILEALVAIGACQSKGEARRLINSGGVYINNLNYSIEDGALGLQHLIYEKLIVIRRGKKNYYLVKLP